MLQEKRFGAFGRRKLPGPFGRLPPGGDYNVGIGHIAVGNAAELRDRRMRYTAAVKKRLANFPDFGPALSVNKRGNSPMKSGRWGWRGNDLHLMTAPHQL